MFVWSDFAYKTPYKTLANTEDLSWCLFICFRRIAITAELNKPQCQQLKIIVFHLQIKENNFSFQR